MLTDAERGEVRVFHPVAHAWMGLAQLHPSTDLFPVGPKTIKQVVWNRLEEIVGPVPSVEFEACLGRRNHLEKVLAKELQRGECVVLRQDWPEKGGWGLWSVAGKKP